MPASFARNCFGPPTVLSFSNSGEAQRRASWTKNPETGADVLVPPSPGGALYNGRTSMIIVGHQRTCGVSIPVLNYKNLVTAPLSEFSLVLSSFMTARVGMFSLAWRTGRVLALAFYVRRQYKNAEAKTKALEAAGKPAEASEDVWDDVHKRMSALICRHMLEFQGLWIKVGQFLSTRADIMPDAWIEELRVLQDAVPPERWATTHATLQEEFQVDDPSSLFARIDETPLATASIASVHRATTRDGREVVIKVQRRGVDSIVSTDLANLRFLARRLAKEDAKFDVTGMLDEGMLDEWAEETMHELDFVNEAHNTELVARNLANARHPVPVKVPKVVRADGIHPTRRVLVLEYIDGCKITEPEALTLQSGVKLVQDISAAFAQQVFVDGVFNADPHPGNLMVERGSGKAVLIDFGLTKHVPRPMRIAFARLLISAAELDYAGLLMAINEMGLPVSIEDPADAMDTMRYLLRDAGEAPPSPKRRPSGSNGEGGSPGRDEGGDIDLTREVRASSATHCAATGKRYPSLATPGSVLFLVRVISCLRGMAVTLDVQHSYLEAMRPYAKQALRDAFAADRAAARDGVSAPQHQPLSTFVAPRAQPSLAQDRVVAAMVAAVAAGETLGVQTCVYHEGRLLLNCAAGELGVTDPRHVQLDSLFCAFSCGKTVCAALLHVLADKGLLSLDERVASFWPEYGCHGKEKTTVRMVLEHRSGLAHVLPDLDQGMVRKMTDWRYMVNLLAASEPTEPVGEFRYHYLTYGWLVGGIAERVVARRGATSFYAAKGEAPPTFAQLVDEHIVLPLRLTGQMYVGLPDEKDARAAQHVVYQRLASVKAVQPGGGGGGGEAEEGGGGGGDMFDMATGSGGSSGAMALDPRVFNDLVVRRACIPAANMHFTAHALATIYAALAADGSVGEARLLSARYASELQRALRVPASDDNPIPFGLRTFDLTATPGAFGFNGMANSVGLAHPGLGSLSVVVLVNQLTVYADAPKRVLGAVCEALGYELPDWGGLGFQEPEEDEEAE